MSKLPQAVEDAIRQAALQVLTSASIDPQLATHVPGREVIQVAQDIAAAAQAKPTIQHLASSESSPWQSRAHWAMIASIFGPVVGLGGITLAPEYLDGIATVGWLIANGFAAWMAYRARTATKPLGT